MSLNRYEQYLYDYIESLPEERRYWFDRVIDVESQHRRRETAALVLNSELWEYFEERSAHEPVFSNLVSKGQGKLSMLNLAEYYLRMWSPLARKK